MNQNHFNKPSNIGVSFSNQGNQDKTGSASTLKNDNQYKKFYDTPKKRIVWYLIGSAFILYLYSTLYPFLLDYYVEGSTENIFSYLYDHYLADNPYYRYESTLLLLSGLLIYFLTTSPGWATGVISVFGVILAYASKIKYENRMELINYTDLKLTEGVKTFSEYIKFRPSWALMAILLFAILITGAGAAIHLLIQKDLRYLKKTIWVIRGVTVILLGSGLYLYNSDFLNKEQSKDIAKSIEYMTENSNRYLIYRFLASNQIAYSPTEALESYHSLMDQAKELGINLVTTEQFDIQTAPTIIVIANESWWDLDHIPKENISFSLDPMKPLHDLESKCHIGTVGVNIYGGGTICSEEEYKLGVNTKYFSSSLTIYQTLEERQISSVTDYFNNLGYRTTAIHPFYGDFYNRTSLYQKEGYDRIIFFKDMDYTEPYDRYISDDSMMNQIIHEFEQNSTNDPDHPDYIFALSIASHVTTLDYEKPFIENYDYPIQVNMENGTILQYYDDFVHYVNGIYYSNLAITKLIEYFENQERPVMILMFGDHCPSLNVYDLRALGLEAGGEGENHVDKMQVNPGLMGDQVADDIMEALYTTPVLEWDNFSNIEFESDKDNVCFLTHKMIEQAFLPDTPSTVIQKVMQTQFQSDIRAFSIDPSGNQITSFSQEQYKAAQDYLMIQYDSLYGDQICGDLWKPFESNNL